MKTKNTVINANNYSISIGNTIFADLNEFVTKTEYADNKIFILVDENTLEYCLPKLISEIECFKNAEIIEIESGEESKNIEVCTVLWQTLSELGANRNSLLVNLGGGVISDLGGFIASTFKRGIDFINIPTTLLAQVDASVGGKVGIDFNSLKNEIGLFNSPSRVFIYPSFLKSLSKRQLLSGFAEVIKHALIADKNYWTTIKSSAIADTNNWEKLIVRSIEIKNKIVLEDPKEKQIRKSLNFGHTIGHAIESASIEGKGTSLLHGEAIGIGMVCEAFLSYKKAQLKHYELDEITSFILSFYSIKLDPFDDHRLIELMRHDKKNDKNTINFTLISEIGKAEINKTCSIELIKAALNYYREQVNMNATSLDLQ